MPYDFNKSKVKNKFLGDLNDIYWMTGMNRDSN